MTSRVGAFVLSLLALGLLALSAEAGAVAVPVPGPEPVSYFVIEARTGAVLAEKSPDLVWPPASMAKMMTMLVALEDVAAGRASLDDPVTVSAEAAGTGGSQVYLAKDEVFTLGQLMQAAMVASANDASVAVAEHLGGGTVSGFVERMNARAKELGLKGTKFVTPHGLPPGKDEEGDLTTARDLAMVARELVSKDVAMEWASTPVTTFRNGTFEMRNTNRLITTYTGATGLKTGYVRRSGFSVTATAQRGDLSVIAVVLGLSTRNGCFDEATRLLNEAFSNYELVVAARAGVPVGSVPVAGGENAEVAAVPTEDLRLVVRRSGERAVAVEARIPRLLQAPVSRRQELGVVVVRQGEDELGRVPVVAADDVRSTGWLTWFWQQGDDAGSTAD
jgi:D-alanyl-D-alanine carboxypeptidase (penicillin-binding protein 5/6)